MLQLQCTNASCKETTGSGASGFGACGGSRGQLKILQSFNSHVMLTKTQRLHQPAQPWPNLLHHLCHQQGQQSSQGHPLEMFTGSRALFWGHHRHPLTTGLNQGQKLTVQIDIDQLDAATLLWFSIGVRVQGLSESLHVAGINFEEMSRFDIDHVV